MQPGRCSEKEGGYREGTRERADERLYRKSDEREMTRKRKQVNWAIVTSHHWGVVMRSFKALGSPSRLLSPANYLNLSDHV